LPAETEVLNNRFASSVPVVASVDAIERDSMLVAMGISKNGWLLTRVTHDNVVARFATTQG
jgi:hypothetical protein